MVIKIKTKLKLKEYLINEQHILSQLMISGDSEKYSYALKVVNTIIDICNERNKF